MKRIPKILISSLMLSSVFIPPSPTFAAIADKGTTWWSVEELLEFNEEVELEKVAECGDDEECKMEFGFTMFDRGPKYSALNSLLDAQIWVTSVNPAEETIKVLFFDDEMMLKRMGIEEKIHLEHLYVGWVEEWSGQIFNYDHDRFIGGSITGNHPMYDGSSEVNGEDWIPAWEEYELSVAGSNLIDNTHGRIDYAVFAKNNMFNAQGSFDYLSCLNAADYQEETECKMYVSGDQGYSYFPPREQIVEQSTVSEEENQPEVVKEVYCNLEEALQIVMESAEINCQLGKVPYSYYVQEWEKLNSNPDSDDVPEVEPEPTFTLTPEPEPESNNNPLSNPPLALVKEDPIAPKAPETGRAGNYTDSSDNSLETPWWFIFLNIIGALLLVWWFMPTPNEIIRKNAKKSEKRVLTKKADCDKMVSV
ncbi:hypothetical protein IKG49_00130 [Candidatus Saccharibacteria bacterium]|nr:hypothetical protein [Candidatus Saccharibacteria bacterium]